MRQDLMMQQGGRIPDDGRCTAHRGSCDGVSCQGRPDCPSRCPNTAEGLVTVGCVHEHVVVDAPVCTVCLNWARWSMQAGRYLCTNCQYGRQPHDCQVMITSWEPQ